MITRPKACETPRLKSVIGQIAATAVESSVDRAFEGDTNRCSSAVTRRSAAGRGTAAATVQTRLERSLGRCSRTLRSAQAYSGIDVLVLQGFCRAVANLLKEALCAALNQDSAA